jgi:hypothetical protein
MSGLSTIPALLRTGFVAGLLSIALFAGSQESWSATAPSVTTLIQQMVGTWSVQSRMWPGAHAKAVELPPAVARRELIADAFLREVMGPADERSAQDRFARVAYFSYNVMNRQYEYFSLDSRLPQMMSYAVPGANKMRSGKVELAGTSFVAPEWGADKNVPFMYRLAIGPVENGQQTMQLFLTEQGGRNEEFLAFEYVYRRNKETPH